MDGVDGGDSAGVWKVDAGNVNIGIGAGVADGVGWNVDWEVGREVGWEVGLGVLGGVVPPPAVAPDLATTFPGAIKTVSVNTREQQTSSSS